MCQRTRVAKGYFATWNLGTKRIGWNWQSAAWSALERLRRRWTSNNDIADCRFESRRMGGQRECEVRLAEHFSDAGYAIGRKERQRVPVVPVHVHVPETGN